MLVAATTGCRSSRSFPIPTFRFALHHVGRRRSAVTPSPGRPRGHDSRPDMDVVCVGQRASTPATRCRRTPGALDSADSTEYPSQCEEVVSHDVPRRDHRGCGKRQAQRRRQLLGAASLALIVPAGRMSRRAPCTAFRRGGRNNDRRRIVTRCSGGCAPNLLQKINTLLCVMELNAGQTLLVSFVHLFEYIVLCHCSLWQKMPQELFDVRAAQERMRVFGLYPFLQHEKHCHEHQRHVVMPRAPFTHLIIRQSTFGFTILECSLCPQ